MQSFIIYKTTNLINGKIYVGKSMSNNSEYLGSRSKKAATTLKNNGINQGIKIAKSLGADGLKKRGESISQTLQSKGSEFLSDRAKKAYQTRKNNQSNAIKPS